MNKLMTLFVVVSIAIKAEYKPIFVAGAQEFHAGNEKNRGWHS